MDPEQTTIDEIEELSTFSSAFLLIQNDEFPKAL
jgi:hypothetical protein